MAERKNPNMPEGSDDPAAQRPDQHEVNALHASAQRSGRGAAQWFGIALAAVVAILVLGALVGGGSWIWAPAPDESAVETGG